MRTLLSISSNTLLAKHLTDAKSASKIMSSGKFKPSSSGWLGAGLYAHTGTGTEGKGTSAVYFDYSGLNLCTEDKPEELTQKEWERLSKMPVDQVNRKLAALGYDGYYVSHKGWIVIFPSSVSKIRPVSLDT